METFVFGFEVLKIPLIQELEFHMDNLDSVAVWDHVEYRKFTVLFRLFKELGHYKSPFYSFG